MIKKINKYLLENHPLIWNTKFVWMLAVLFVMHILFFIIGFVSYLSPVDLHDTSFFQKYFDSGFVWIGVLLTILILILWMNYYFKHNAFKAHYPKSDLSIYKEFLIIFLIAFLSVTQYFSYTQGLKTRISMLKTSAEIEKEIDLVNQVAPFTLKNNDYNNYGSQTYNQNNRCADVPVFDSLVSEDAVLKLFISRKFKNSIWNLTPDDTIHYQKFKDSLQTPLYKNEEFDYILIQHLPKRKNWRAPEDYKTQEPYISENNYYQYDETIVPEAVEAADAVAYPGAPATYLSFNLNSIYNFCSLPLMVSDSIKNGEYYAKKTYNLLHNQKKDSIQVLLDDYLNLVKEYEVGHRFRDKNWIDYVYNPPYYFVDYELSSPSRYSDAHKKHFKKDYISHADMRNTLVNLGRSKSCIFDPVEYLICLYIALGIALMIFTFRMTSMKTWIISVVGSIVIYFIFFSLFFLVGLLIFGMEESLASILFLCFVFIFWFLAYSGILSEKRKLISGVNFIWSIWTFPAILPVIVALYTSYLDWKFPYRYGPNSAEHPHLIWIRDNWDLIFGANLILVLLFVFLILPVIKKWQAMAEE